MKKKLTNNLLLKILSVLIAFSLWFVVINIDDPVDEKTFSNIKVNLINTDVLAAQDKVYEVLDGSDVLKVKVEANRSLLENLSASDIVAEADFKKVTEDNTVEINLYSTRSNDEIRSISSGVTAVKLNVEDKKSKRLMLRTEIAGEPESGYIVGSPVMDQNRVEISGPESVISEIASAALKVDVSDWDRAIFTYADVVLYDADKKVIESDTVTMNTNHVKVTVPILRTKVVPIVVETTGVPAEGYAATGVVEQSVNSVMIAAEDSVIAGINRIVIPKADLDITDDTETLEKTYSIKRFLPENVVLADEETKITVKVFIEKLKEQAFKIPAEQIHLVGVPKDYEVKLAGDSTEFNLYLKGLEADLKAVQISEIEGFIQVDNYMESLDVEKVEDGVYLVSIEFDFSGNVVQIRDVKALISIQIIEEM